MSHGALGSPRGWRRSAVDADGSFSLQRIRRRRTTTQRQVSTGGRSGSSRHPVPGRSRDSGFWALRAFPDLPSSLCCSSLKPRSRDVWKRSCLASGARGTTHSRSNTRL